MAAVIRMNAYNVSVETVSRETEAFEDFPGSQFLREVWKNASGQIHRADGPAVVIRHNETAELLGEYWYVNGELHREQGPAITARNPTNNTAHVVYLRNGQMHREDGPAEIRYENSIPIIQRWLIDGMRHRVGGPCSTIRDPNTDITLHEEWAVSGQSHRVGGPASVTCDETTGVVTEEEWSCKGLPHREEGPAIIGRDRITGKVIAQHFYLNGDEIARSQKASPAQSFNPSP